MRSRNAAPAGDRRQTVQSAEVGFRVFLALAEAGEGGSLAAIAARAGMPGAKAHRYLRSLIATGLAEQDPDTGRYALGPAALRVGVAALGRASVVRAAAAHLAALREETGQTCFLAVPAEAGPTVVLIEAPVQAVTVNIRLGSALPAELSASGRALRAFSGAPDAEAEAIRAAGCASVRGTVLPGVDAVAAPVLDHRGLVAGIVTLLGPTGAFDPAPEGRVAEAVRRAARAASVALGRAG
jgi:DNA-binding IclR family transcriptional regulator